MKTVLKSGAAQKIQNLNNTSEGQEHNIPVEETTQNDVNIPYANRNTQQNNDEPHSEEIGDFPGNTFTPELENKVTSNESSEPFFIPKSKNTENNTPSSEPKHKSLPANEDQQIHELSSPTDQPEKAEDIYELAKQQARELFETDENNNNSTRTPEDIYEEVNSNQNSQQRQETSETDHRMLARTLGIEEPPATNSEVDHEMLARTLGIRPYLSSQDILALTLGLNPPSQESTTQNPTSSQEKETDSSGVVHIDEYRNYR